MATTDYDQPRTRPEGEEQIDSLEGLRAAQAPQHEDLAMLDEANLGEDLELPGADLSSEELVVRVVAQQRDEFVCRSCFMLTHVSRRATGQADLCRDCA
jgi:hypothetical protein